MGNENKMKEVSISDINFLPEEIKDVDAIKEFYSLEEEFSKTKKNKNVGLYLLILSFFTIVIGSTYLFTQFIQNQNRNVEINITEFEDLRLKEVIDSARSHENNLDLLQIRLEILKVNHKKYLLDIKQKYYKKKIDVLSRDLSTKNTDRALARLKATEKKELAALDVKYATKISEKEKEINEVKEELEIKKEMEQKGASTVISNIDRLNKLKMEKLKKSNDSGVIILREYYDKYVNYLVSLYNPKFKSKQITSIIKTKTNDRNLAKAFHPIYNQENIINYKDYQTLRIKSQNNHRLMNRLLRIPYTNSVTPALKRINATTHAIESDYENLLRQFTRTTIWKNQLIHEYQQALDFLLEHKKENGYIVNADNPQSILIHLNRLYRLEKLTTAMIIGQNDEYIGRIEFIQSNKNLRAKMIDLAHNKTIQPFDKILLEIN